MSVVEKTQTVNGSLPAAWEAISRMGAVEEWHPNVAHVDVLTDADTGVGAARRVEFQDGNSVVETVVSESNREFTTVEMTESPPLRDAYVTIRVQERSANTTDVTFSISYKVKYGPIGWLMDVAMLRRMFSGVFEVALNGLSYHLETGELVRDAVPER